MRNLFFEYYRPSQKAFESLWSEATFCFDANVLLDVYRYTPATRDQLLDILASFRERIWIPYQVGKEFHKNRLQVIKTQENPYEQINARVSKAINELKNKLSELSLEGRRPHPFIDIHQIYGILDYAAEQVQSLLNHTRESNSSLLEDDTLLIKLSDLFDSKVGKPYEQDELDKRHDEIRLRYEKSIPPGYKDLDTKNPPIKGDIDSKAYGDAIAWLQIVDFAKETKRPIILITSDTKEDWWLRIDGKTIGPRPELIKEMREKAGVDYYQYTADKFIELAQAHLNIESSPQAVNEVREYRLKDEESPAYQALLMAEKLVEIAKSQLQFESKLDEHEKRLELVADAIEQVDLSLASSSRYVSSEQAKQISEAVKTVALLLGKKTGRNEFGSVYGELYRKYGITGYKQIPASKFQEVLDWLNRWRENHEGDLPL